MTNQEPVMTTTSYEQQPPTAPDQTGPLPPLPPFDPHVSTTETGGTVEDTQRSDLGILASLIGRWSGTGLNVIWTPSEQAVTGSDRFLQLASTEEVQEYTALGGSIPNRGLRQPDLFMSGVRYTQEISSNGDALHFEDGVWLNVPATTVPAVGASVARMASIPHGTTLNAQGTVSDLNPDGLQIPAAPITPFSTGSASAQIRMPEQDLSVDTKFRTPDSVGHGFDQTTLDDVNTFLRLHVPPAGGQVAQIQISTVDTPAMPGGGVANTAFLGPNATTSSVTTTIWLFTPAGQSLPSDLLYSQTVVLDFNGLSWPHVTVGALRRVTG